MFGDICFMYLLKEEIIKKCFEIVKVKMFKFGFDGWKVFYSKLGSKNGCWNLETYKFCKCGVCI